MCANTANMRLLWAVLGCYSLLILILPSQSNNDPFVALGLMFPAAKKKDFPFL